MQIAACNRCRKVPEWTIDHRSQCFKVECDCRVYAYPSALYANAYEAVREWNVEQGMQGIGKLEINRTFQGIGQPIQPSTFGTPLDNDWRAFRETRERAERLAEERQRHLNRTKQRQQEPERKPYRIPVED